MYEIESDCDIESAESTSPLTKEQLDVRPPKDVRKIWKDVEAALDIYTNTKLPMIRTGPDRGT